jgi:protein-S-isoprenylcysteine O-methyltransferase Ste14
VSFTDQLINVLYKITTGSKKVRTLLTPVGATLFFCFVILFIVLSLHLDRVLKLPKILPSPLNFVLSLPLLFFGLFLVLWSVLHFLKVNGTPVPFNPPPRLVITGPYAHVRNPMLIGVFILLFGFGTAFRSVSLFFIVTPLFICFNVWELKSIEEPELSRRLGQEYIKYKARTPMFIPALRIKCKDKK